MEERRVSRFGNWLVNGICLPSSVLESCALGKPTDCFFNCEDEMSSVSNLPMALRGVA